MSPRQLDELAGLFNTPVGTGEQEDDEPAPALPRVPGAGTSPESADAGEPGRSPMAYGLGASWQGVRPAGPDADEYLAPGPTVSSSRGVQEPPADRAEADCILGVQRGSGPKRRMTIGLPLAVAAELRSGQEQLRRHRSITDFVLSAVGALGDGGNPAGESDWPPGRYQTALFLAESEREELERRARERGVSVSALVAVAISPYLEGLQ